MKPFAFINNMHYNIDRHSGTGPTSDSICAAAQEVMVRY